MSKMLQLGGLWINESKKGEKYMVGYLGNLRLLVFKNQYKEEEKHPDYIMYVDEKDREEKGKSDDDMLGASSEDVAF